jgi:hypothetical protein
MRGSVTDYKFTRDFPIAVESYRSYSNGNYGSNTICVELPALLVWFSYWTPIAFRSRSSGCEWGELVMRNNDWGPTTDGHMRSVIDGQCTTVVRMDGAFFERALLDAYRRSASKSPWKNPPRRPGGYNAWVARTLRMIGHYLKAALSDGPRSWRIRGQVKRESMRLFKLAARIVTLFAPPKEAPRKPKAGRFERILL